MNSLFCNVREQYYPINHYYSYLAWQNVWINILIQLLVTIVDRHVILPSILSFIQRAIGLLQ